MKLVGQCLNWFSAFHNPFSPQGDYHLSHQLSVIQVTLIMIFFSYKILFPKPSRALDGIDAHARTTNPFVSGAEFSSFATPFIEPNKNKWLQMARCPQLFYSIKISSEMP
jgi:hypothetical protein